MLVDRGANTSPVDSQRTLTETLGEHRVPQVTNGSMDTHTKESEENKTRRLKGKAPMGKNKRQELMTTSNADPKNRPGIPIICENTNVATTAEAEMAGHHTSPIIESSKQNEDSDEEEMMEMEYENTIKELEKPIMDNEMIENDDFLGDEPHPASEKIEAISQLSPAIDQNTVPTSTQWPLSLSEIEKQERGNPSTSSGTRKKTPTSPEVKGARASKKLQLLRGRSPKKKSQKG